MGRRLGLAPENPAMQLADSTLWNIRFPRVLLGVLVGAALGTSGAGCSRCLVTRWLSRA